LKKGAGEHILHCDGSLKGLEYAEFEQKCSAASYRQLLPLFLHFVMLITNGKISV
jgi:hypothetical protein